MTIPGLLRKVGINVPRGVTVNGQIVLEGRPSGVGVAAAQSYGLAPHRFHGGDDPSPARNDLTGAWWNQDSDARDADIADMRHRFANTTVYTEDGNLAYMVKYDTGRGLYDCLILPQINGSLPAVYFSKSKKPGRRVGRHHAPAPHLYTNGALCIAEESDWDGKGYLTSIAAAWTAHWLACYTEWRITGRWPTDGYGVRAA